MSNIQGKYRFRDRGVGFALAAVLAPITVLALSAAHAGAETSPADKSQFTIFHPTPVALLRELSTDRPDTTESPLTVDAGHFLLELGFVDFTRNRSRGITAEQTVAAPFNLKVGLLNNVDLEFGLDPFVRVRTQARGSATERMRGIGDSLVRLKINLWGNDGPQDGFGKTAFGLIPFVKTPTARASLGNGRVEGGLILPLAVDLPAGFDLGMMGEFDLLRNEDNTRYGLEFVHSITVGHKILGLLGGYFEYVGIAPSGTGTNYRAFFSTGLIYPVGKNVQLDAGTRIGLSKKSDALNLFTGISVRF